MDSPQSVVSPLKSSSVFPESEKQSTNLSVENSSILSKETKVQEKRTENGDAEDIFGALDVYIHQARDIHNICIYQKQDVYAKICVTNDPEKTVSTRIINGGGRNPVFNENMQLSVRKVDASLKCEIWMLSRVRNYLEDQLLGFALVPISEVLLHNGKLEQEFSLSSTDLFHSPAGFVHLSVSYVGTQPEVILIPAPAPAPATSAETNSIMQDAESAKSVHDGLDKIEFPDPKVANENDQMVEEYISMPCSNLDSQSSESLISSDTETPVSSEAVIEPQELRPDTKIESPPSSVSTNGASSASVPASSESSETPKDTKSPNEERLSPPKDNPKKNSPSGLETDSNASVGISSHTFIKPIVPEPEVVQQDIVDMYMKSMQQFTESLAKMKLPMDFESGPPSSENSSTDQKSPASKSSRVFYGSRAFF